MAEHGGNDLLPFTLPLITVKDTTATATATTTATTATRSTALHSALDYCPDAGKLKS